MKPNLIVLCATVAMLFSACEKDEVKTADKKLDTKALQATTNAVFKAENPYQLIWADEFEGGLDSTKWIVVKGKEM